MKDINPLYPSKIKVNSAGMEGIQISVCDIPKLNRWLTSEIMFINENANGENRGFDLRMKILMGLSCAGSVDLNYFFGVIYFQEEFKV